MTAGTLAVAAGAGATALGPATFIQGLMASGTEMGEGLTMSTVLSLAAIETAAVGAVSDLAGTGLSDRVTVPYLGARSGFDGITPPSAEARKSIYPETVAKFDTPTVTGSGVLAVSQGVYGALRAPAKRRANVQISALYLINTSAFQHAVVRIHLCHRNRRRNGPRIRSDITLTPLLRF